MRVTYKKKKWFLYIRGKYNVLTECQEKFTFNSKNTRGLQNNEKADLSHMTYFGIANFTVN